MITKHVPADRSCSSIDQSNPFFSYFTNFNCLSFTFIVGNYILNWKFYLNFSTITIRLNFRKHCIIFPLLNFSLELLSVWFLNFIANMIAFITTFFFLRLTKFDNFGDCLIHESTARHLFLLIPSHVAFPETTNFTEIYPFFCNIFWFKNKLFFFSRYFNLFFWFLPWHSYFKNIWWLHFWWLIISYLCFSFDRFLYANSLS